MSSEVMEWFSLISSSDEERSFWWDRREARRVLGAGVKP